MKNFLSSILIFAILINSISALTCYTGYTTIFGWQINSETIKCPNENEFCYKALVDGNILMKTYIASCAKVDTLVSF
jgi:hypothetical protein